MLGALRINSTSSHPRKRAPLVEHNAPDMGRLQPPYRIEPTNDLVVTITGPVLSATESGGATGRAQPIAAVEFGDVPNHVDCKAGRRSRGAPA